MGAGARAQKGRHVAVAQTDGCEATAMSQHQPPSAGPLPSGCARIGGRRERASMMYCEVSKHQPKPGVTRCPMYCARTPEALVALQPAQLRSGSLHTFNGAVEEVKKAALHKPPADGSQVWYEAETAELAEAIQRGEYDDDTQAGFAHGIGHAFGVVNAAACKSMRTMADPVAGTLLQPNDATVDAMLSSTAGHRVNSTVVADSCLGNADAHGNYGDGGSEGTSGVGGGLSDGDGSESDNGVTLPEMSGASGADSDADSVESGETLPEMSGVDDAPVALLLAADAMWVRCPARISERAGRCATPRRPAR